MINKLHLDFETRSKADLKKIGAYNYSKHLSTSVLCCAWAVNDEPVNLIPYEEFDNAIFGEVSDGLAELYNYAARPDTLFIAHNAMFERCIWRNILVHYSYGPNVPLIRWRCTLAKGAYYSLPKSLNNLSGALGLGHKFEEGKNAMMRLTKPKAPSAKDPSIWVSDPAKFELMYKYCKEDVELERTIDNALPDLTTREQRIWYFDQRMNDRGIPIDTESVDLVQTRFNQLMDDGAAEFESITGFGVKKVQQYKAWLSEWGIETESVDAANVKRMMDDISEEVMSGSPAEEHEVVYRSLELRQLLGATTSITKLQSMLDYANTDDHRVRDAFQYSSGITHRWGGKAIQPQNLPRADKNMDAFVEILDTGYIDSIESIEQIKKGLRAFIKAKSRYKLLVGDYAQIEARVLMWLAGETKGIEKFENNEDIYLDLAMQIYGVLLTKENKNERQLGKMGVLGAGYQMGAGRFMEQAKTQWGMTIEPELAELTIQTYRKYYRKVVSFWYDQERAAIAAMETGQAIGTEQGITWCKEEVGPNKLSYLVCTLRSGTKMYYFKPWLTNSDFYGKSKPQLNYYKVDPQSGRSVPDKTYGGKLVENIVQATARDIMAAGMLRIVKYNKEHKKRYDTTMTVHDELVAEVPDTDEYTEQEFLDILIQREKWFATAPIDAEVKTCYRYTK